MNAKQRKLKKLAIILLAVIAILAISIPVFAATNGDAATTTAPPKPSRIPQQLLQPTTRPA